MKDERQVRLHSSLVGSADAPNRLFVLHGVFGAGRNWASVMRTLVSARPDWAARLIDLRQHGASQGFEPPHTLMSAARDLDELAGATNEKPRAVLGHSFGGKVALMYAREHGVELSQVWLVDSTPEAVPPGGSAWQMLELVRRAPRVFASRDELIALLEASGFTRPTAQWMATNLELRDGRYRWRFDINAMEQLLHDFFAQDLWQVLESADVEIEIHIVKARESSVLSPAAVKRISELRSTGRVFLHHVAGGHWVNAENPDGILNLLTRHLHV